jgi:hypothetical protein
MLQVKKVVAVAQVVQLLSARAHDGDDQPVVQFRVEGFDTIGALHG